MASVLPFGNEQVGLQLAQLQAWSKKHLCQNFPGSLFNSDPQFCPAPLTQNPPGKRPVNALHPECHLAGPGSWGENQHCGCQVSAQGLAPGSVSFHHELQVKKICTRMFMAHRMLVISIFSRFTFKHVLIFYSGHI